MPPMMRFTPGSIAPVSSTYALVGHYGEATNIALWLDAGERLPTVASAVDFGPLWYVQVDVANESAGIA